MISKKKSFARFGMLSKGAVYTIIGVLTALTAFGLGGEKTGSKGALQYLAEQPFGRVMLIVMGIGLVGYLFWRMYQVFANPSKFDDDLTGIGKRIGYFISGLIYGGLAFYAFKLAFGSGGGNSMMSSILSGSKAIAIVIGLGMAIKAIYDFYRAYSGKFKEEVEEASLSHKEQKLLVNAGKFGHTARGIVLGIMSYLTLKTGLSSSEGINTQGDAFDFIQNEFGSLALGIVAIGLIGYGIYMFIKAKYPSIVVR